MKLLSLILPLWLLVLGSLAQAVEYPISSGRTLEQRADSLYEMVSKEMVFVSKKQDKFKAIKLTTAQLQELLGDSEATEEQGAYVKEYIAALQSLPTGKALPTAECSEYPVEEKAKPLLQNLCELK